MCETDSWREMRIPPSENKFILPHCPRIWSFPAFKSLFSITYSKRPVRYQKRKSYSFSGKTVMLVSWYRTFAKPSLRLLFSRQPALTDVCTIYTKPHPCLWETQTSEEQLVGNQGRRQCPEHCKIQSAHSLFKTVSLYELKTWSTRWNGNVF